MDVRLFETGGADADEASLLPESLNRGEHVLPIPSKNCIKSVNNDNGGTGDFTSQQWNRKK